MSTGTDDARRAIAEGIAFLERTQLPDGDLPTMRWFTHDPAAAVHDPTLFGPALIVASLANVPGTEALRARAAGFIAGQMLRFGVWKYSPTHGGGLPPDLDDTAMACLALRIAGRAVPGNGYVFAANRDRDGRFFTWLTPRLRWLATPRMLLIALARWRHPIVHYRTFRRESAPRRNDVDPVVNANVLFYFGRTPQTEPAIDFILSVLREGTETTSDKWYDNPFIVLYCFSRALRRAGVDAREALLERLAAAVPRTPLDHALAACVLLDCGESAGSSIEAVIRTQPPSGGWPRIELYKGDDTRWGSEPVTTAFCLEALSRWLARAAAQEQEAAELPDVLQRVPREEHQVNGQGDEVGPMRQR